MIRCLQFSDLLGMHHSHRSQFWSFLYHKLLLRILNSSPKTFEQSLEPHHQLDFKHHIIGFSLTWIDFFTVCLLLIPDSSLAVWVDWCKCRLLASPPLGSLGYPETHQAEPSQLVSLQISFQATLLSLSNWLKSAPPMYSSLIPNTFDFSIVSSGHESKHNDCCNWMHLGTSS